jgi:pimeloyl-ACP methyl ester carboxylesterase
MSAVDNYSFDARQVSKLSIPTLLLLGSESPDFFGEGIKMLDNAVSDTTLVIISDQAHGAIDNAPELFVKEVVAFLIDKR